VYLKLCTLSKIITYSIFVFTYAALLLISNCALSQSKKNNNIDPIGINAVGGSYTNINLMFDWNIGEVFSKPISNTNKLLVTPGFLQSFDMEVIIKSNVDTVLIIDTIQKYINAYPNPVKNDLQISLLQINLKILSIILLDQNGNSLQVFDEQFNTQVHYNKTLHMGFYAPNLYLLSIRYVLKGNYYRTKIFKIIKS